MYLTTYLTSFWIQLSPESWVDEKIIYIQYSSANVAVIDFYGAAAATSESTIQIFRMVSNNWSTFAPVFSSACLPLSVCVGGLKKHGAVAQWSDVYEHVYSHKAAQKEKQKKNRQTDRQTDNNMQHTLAHILIKQVIRQINQLNIAV